jgi:hypothetical protein
MKMDLGMGFEPAILPQRFSWIDQRINDWCAMTTSLGVVLKRWRFTCYWSR